VKIYILVDLEGISGIGLAEHVKSTSPKFPEACKLMMEDINVAIDAGFLSGATEIVVCDTHAGGGQLQLEKMDPRAVYEAPNRESLMPSLDASFDGVVLLGSHARAGTIDGFLDHTIDSSAWFEYKLNGQVLGETGIEAAFAGHYDVPVVMVSGDHATAQEAREVLGDVETAVVKWGIGRNRAKCLSPSKARERIRETMRRALDSIHKFKPFKPSLPATIQLTLYRSDMADQLVSKAGVKRIDARTSQFQIASLVDVCRW
jgi:D-amino peptidase